MQKMYAHVDADTKRTQTFLEHINGTKQYAIKSCPLNEILFIAIAVSILHDAGKLGEEFQSYMRDILLYGEKARKRLIDHSSAGGWVIEKIIRSRNPATIFLSAIIYSHHGLQDLVDMNTGEILSEKRNHNKIDFELIENRLFKIIDKNALVTLLSQAYKEIQSIYNNIFNHLKGKEGKCGCAMFYFGMYERLVLSLLIDSDWTDTSNFFDEMVPRQMKDSIQDVWERSINNYDSYMKDLHVNGKKSLLNTYRDEISEYCYRASIEPGVLYRMSAPTGGGKTLAALRFALNHAKKFGKQRIYYIAPYTSILEQNARIIETAVGNRDIVLEHHCNVIPDEDRENMYQKLSENWDCPIVVTTAVQLMNTLFSSMKSSIRRMHRLCNSVIIFDEVQAIPLKQTELFNLGVNFLAEFCNTTVVLCSATQPSLVKLEKNNLLPQCHDILPDQKKYMDVFKRVDIIDKTCPGGEGMELDELCDFASQQLECLGSVLIIVNTRPCARDIYRRLKELYSDQYEIYHLSTYMCPQNRLEELDSIKKDLLHKKPIICVSTQLIEAGVDISFGAVIRSLAGLDSIIQAIGRCNRHKEQMMGRAYIVKLSDNLENLDKLKDIQLEANATADFLYHFTNNPEAFDDRIDSVESLSCYYRILTNNRNNQDGKIRVTQYPSQQYSQVDPDGSRCYYTTLDELLGDNPLAQNQFRRTHSNTPKLPMQAFRTAGDEFEAIENDNKISVVIPYDSTAEKAIRVVEDKKATLQDKKKSARILNKYTVSVSQGKFHQLGDAIHISEAGMCILNIGFYDKKEGILDNPKNELLLF